MTELFTVFGEPHCASHPFLHYQVGRRICDVTYRVILPRSTDCASLALGECEPGVGECDTQLTRAQLTLQVQPEDLTRKNTQHFYVCAGHVQTPPKQEHTSLSTLKTAAFYQRLVSWLCTKLQRKQRGSGVMLT